MDNLKNTISKRANLFKILLFVAAAAVIAYFFPNDNNREYVYKVGKPWSYSLLTAPFDMPIFLDSATVKAKKDSIDKAFVLSSKSTGPLKTVHCRKSRHTTKWLSIPATCASSNR